MRNLQTRSWSVSHRSPWHRFLLREACWVCGLEVSSADDPDERSECLERGVEWSGVENVVELQVVCLVMELEAALEIF